MFFLKKKQSRKSPSLRSEEPLLKIKPLPDKNDFWKQSYKSYEDSMKMLMFESEQEPWQLSQNYYSTYAPIDTRGYIISDPDRSNPTRSRTERPLQTIMGFEEAIYRNKFGDQRTNSMTSQSSYMYPMMKYECSGASTYAPTLASKSYDESYDQESEYKCSTFNNSSNLSGQCSSNDRYSQYPDNSDEFYSSTSSSNHTYGCDNSSENNYHASIKYNPSPLARFPRHQQNRYRSLYEEYDQSQYGDLRLTITDSPTDIKAYRSPSNEIQRFLLSKANPKSNK
ncbi:hypothetical protein T552_00441 [Pneumocystis carinii B80]|uniref:Uncharacterized protein n=1 Tax=Pneumocystis carinii (strain B80) TaxID=1408658 RepID=A0A0W4ZQS1_PNEC8|nr:hypothetical protein T552_00441 [Pneumocystis carinii B80]KTW30729.1 hypothetical protein T552_00441 [Pneumocystis carinii B80]